MDKQIYQINYLGKTYNTTVHKDITDEEFEEVKAGYYEKPRKEDVVKQFHNLLEGGVKTNFITNYYVKDLVAKTRVHYNNWSIEEALNYKPIVEWLAGKVNDNKKVFPDTMSLTKKIEVAFRLCGFKVASKPSNFPIQAVDEMLKLYNVNGNYYDFSCGWGARLLSAMRNGVNYYGTDPNHLLVERLRWVASDFMHIINEGLLLGEDIIQDMRIQGSEVFIPEWENKMGLAFSSPPYFNLEDYKIGKQSWHEGVTYEEWKRDYLRPTIANIYRYLIGDGVFAININNFKKYNDYDLIGDTIAIAESEGFFLNEVRDLKNIKRCHGHQGKTKGECSWYDNDEHIFIFKKRPM